MAERTNALVLKTGGGKTSVGSNPTTPARAISTDFNGLFALILLKIVKIIETFAFWFCTLWVPSPLEGELQADRKTENKEGGLDEEGDTSGGNGRSSRYAGHGARCYGAGDHHDGRRRSHHDGHHHDEGGPASSAERWSVYHSAGWCAAARLGRSNVRHPAPQVAPIRS